MAQKPTRSLASIDRGRLEANSSTTYIFFPTQTLPWGPRGVDPWAEGPSGPSFKCSRLSGQLRTDGGHARLGGRETRPAEGKPCETSLYPCLSGCSFVPGALITYACICLCIFLIQTQTSVTVHNIHRHFTLSHKLFSLGKPCT